MTNAAQAIGNCNDEIAITLSSAQPVRFYTTNKPAGQAIYLSIADTGCGMDATTMTRICEPFYTTKGVGAGTGLGLSVVHGIISAHGGKFEVRSTLGAGSEFCIILPACGVDQMIEGAGCAAA